jgi:FkbM family methyltransferase
MRPADRKTAFVLAASDQGTLIVNRLDHALNRFGRFFGVGFQLLENTSYDGDEVEASLEVLRLRRKYIGDGVIAIDCGANIGVHTVEWARQMTGWGSVVAIEAQERIFYALAGNIALNNCFNATAMCAAVAAADGTMRIPRPNYLQPASFGSLTLVRQERTEFIGQEIDYSEDALTEVRMVCIDSLPLDRIDLIKLDVEGMELDALNGAREAIARHRPIVVAEALKSDKAKLLEFFDSRGYKSWLLAGVAVLAVHTGDEVLKHLGESPLVSQLLEKYHRPAPTQV